MLQELLICAPICYVLMIPLSAYLLKLLVAPVIGRWDQSDKTQALVISALWPIFLPLFSILALIEGRKC